MLNIKGNGESKGSHIKQGGRKGVLVNFLWLRTEVDVVSLKEKKGYRREFWVAHRIFRKSQNTDKNKGRLGGKKNPSAKPLGGANRRQG